ncbi:hypothetical protein A2701_03785 [Candidatus Amesbacteria bacterium RIFCSPHIGHO2_01_FULL_47_34]|uniref:Uncharacterized protein n=2 Tax=Candidatus Amesiibacteriota TaxID=1752730 RepID=A0A0G1XVN0_9BACT|nr:MAG: hypothetical protein UY28_C0003G0024 [Candidatus Amesbacteria bacterium GW2011_GWB1_48_13]OGC99668.1 MAG: hypothetical protein A2972_04635 [Candidatus Amesbacteria bacterium RIFCSPLOWO2_01_FULL_47_33]OGD00466.1 MAG: hypothetical protein A2701_03785 [Candidatus Amesbacteria bacterium RIFCSPHIGHO2_01_FULL_47_34]
MGAFLSLLLLLSALFRFPMLDRVPPELFGDEIDVGYQAFSLYKTGKDLYGQVLPVYIHSLSEWRAPLLMYMTVPSIALLGNTEYGVRLPEAVFGSLSPVILFFLVYQTTKSKRLAVLSSCILAFLPWHIHYSRAAFEAVILLDLLMLGTLMWLRGRLFLSALFLSLSFYTYSTAAVFVPLWLVFLYLYNKKKFSGKFSYFFLLFLIPFIAFLVSGRAGERFSRLSILQPDTETIDKITFLRSQENTRLEPFFHSRWESMARLFAYNYFRAFSSEFLFVRGDPTVRHNLQYIGQLLPTTAPFLIWGLYLLAKKKQYFWLVWMLLAPLPAALTRDGAWHATRLFLMIPPLSVAIGAGILQLLHFFSDKKFIKLMLVILFSVDFILFAHYYLVHYPKTSWRWWHVGYKQLMVQIPDLTAQYDKIFINNTYEPSLIRFLFYTRFPPALFHSQFRTDKPVDNIYPGYNGFSLADKFFFGDFTGEALKQGLPEYISSDSLYLISQRENIPGDWDWRTSGPAGIKIISATADPSGVPLLYLISRY